MATSPAHKFGQEIGLLLEEIIKPLLAQFAAKHGYYLDSKGPRGKARPGKKVTWPDKYGNTHDLDFVIEKGGTPDTRGRPLAFIEAAWRRYTKHARNKAQEIQGAILPIAEKYHWDAPSKALQFLLATPDITPEAKLPLNKIDLIVRYSNGDLHQVSFQKRDLACNYIRYITE